MSHPHPELPDVGPLASNGLRVIPLGGLGEVGRNMTVFEHAGVDDQELAVELEDRHVAADLAGAAERDDAEGAAGERGRGGDLVLHGAFRCAWAALQPPRGGMDKLVRF